MFMRRRERGRERGVEKDREGEVERDREGEIIRAEIRYVFFFFIIMINIMYILFLVCVCVCFAKLMFETGRLIDSIEVRFGLWCFSLVFELWREELICISV